MTNQYGNELLHRVLLSAMKDIDRICRENGLRYYLHAGTLLGAVNHQGFIPWDDDVDITMMRSDYDRFAEIVQKDYGDRYFLETFRNSESHKSNIITFVILGYKVSFLDGHKENLGIDLSLLYNVPDNLIKRKIQKNFIYLLDKMVFIKYGDLQACSWKSKLLKLFSCFVSRRRLGEMIEKIMEWEKKETKYVGIMYYTDSNPYTGISGYENDMMLRKWYKDPVWLPFEDALFMTISEPEKDLIHRYGPNYAKPYPEEKRIAKHGIIGIISQSANREI